jgi:hypothetical protein
MAGESPRDWWEAVPRLAWRSAYETQAHQIPARTPPPIATTIRMQESLRDWHLRNELLMRRCSA